MDSYSMLILLLLTSLFCSIWRDNYSTNPESVYSKTNLDLGIELASDRMDAYGKHGCNSSFLLMCGSW